VPSEPGRDRAQQHIASWVALPIVDGLKVVNVQESCDQAAVLAAGTFYLVLQLLKADAPTPRACQFVGTRVLAIKGSLRPVARRLLAITGCLTAVTLRTRSAGRRARTTLPTAPTQLLHSKRVPIGEVVSGVLMSSFFVAGLCHLVAQQGKLVASLRRDVSLPGGLIAKARNALALPRRIGTRGASTGINRPAATVITIPVSDSLILI
jgi:hypothetical protein